MAKHDETRRAFLVRAAVGAGAVAGAGLVPEAYAQKNETGKEASATTSSQPHSAGEGRGAFFNHDDAATIEAFAERLMPGAPDKPGARDAGVLNYIDLALAGAYADLQDFYRRGFAQLDMYCRKTYASDQMICWSVSARVGNVKNNEPSLIEAVTSS
jgi:Gluconate 2-dehydrogenase subunit 3